MKKSRLLFLLALAAVFAGWFLLLRPGFLGGPAAYVMVTGHSMEPALYTNDLVVTRKQETYAIGDIVAFRVPKGEPAEGATVIHRIAGGSGVEGFVMQGDNKKYPDPWHPKHGDILGKMWFRVPGAGPLLAFLRAPLPLATLAGWLAVVMVLSGDKSNKRLTQETSVAKPSGGSSSGSGGRLRPPSGLTMWLLLVMVVIAAALASSTRHFG